MIGPELEEITYRYLPEALFERLLRGVFLAHSAAWEECRASYAETEVENLLPYSRRAKFEGYLRDAVAMVSGVTASVEKAEGSSWNHTELRSGPVVLTASSVPVPCGPVNPADFRLKLAEKTLADDGQSPLWDDAAESSAEDESLYVLLLHSKSRWPNAEDVLRYGHLPGSAYIAFPTPDLTRYTYAVNLFSKFPRVMGSLTPQEWDAEARLRYVQRARRMVQ